MTMVVPLAWLQTWLIVPLVAVPLVLLFPGDRLTIESAPGVGTTATGSLPARSLAVAT